MPKMQTRGRTPSMATVNMVESVPISVLSNVSRGFQDHRNFSHRFLLVDRVLHACGRYGQTSQWQNVHFGISVPVRLLGRLPVQRYHFTSFDWDAVHGAHFSKCGNCEFGQVVFTFCRWIKVRLWQKSKCVLVHNDCCIHINQNNKWFIRVKWDKFIRNSSCNLLRICLP